MNCHEVIAALLEVLKPYTENSNMEISDDLNLVIIDSLNNIGFEVIDVNEDYFIEIFEEKNGYTYKVTEADYDSYYGIYFWIPAADILPSGIYDTKEKAIFYAKEATKNK